MRKKKRNSEHESRETGRISALRVGRYDNVLHIVKDVFMPQFEIITYISATGDTVDSSFICISDTTSESGLKEFSDEMEAVNFAKQYRDNLDLG